MFNVFISYDREDAEFAEFLHAKLNLQGLTTYMDQENLQPGQDWREGLDLAIRTSEVMVVIMTPRSAQSLYVTYEWAMALGAGVRVIPIELETGQWHPRLSVLQAMNFSRKPRPWEQLFEEIGKTVEVETVPVPKRAPPAVKKAAAALDSINEEDRISAVSTLVEIDDATAHDAFQLALGHPSRTVRMAAALYAIARGRHHGNAAVMPGLLEVRRNDPLVDRLVPVLWPTPGGGDLSSHGFMHYKFNAAAKQIGPCAVPLLLEILDGKNSQLRDNALTALLQVADASAMQKLIEIVDQAPEHSTEILQCLGGLGDPAALPVLRQSLDHADKNRRASAAQMLGEMKDESSVPALLQLVHEDPSKVVRAAAVGALGSIESQAAVQTLLAVLTDATEPDELRQEAVHPLARMKVVAAAAPLRQLLQTALTDQANGSDWRYATMEALLRLQDLESIPLVIQAIKHTRHHGEHALQAVGVLSEMGDAMLPMAQALLDKNDWVSDTYAKMTGQEVVTLLRRVGSPEALLLAKRWERQNDD